MLEFRQKGCSVAEIADKIGAHFATVSRELVVPTNGPGANPST